MDLLELMKYRRSIRRYTDRQVAEEDLLKILEAGAYAPNAGGGQRSRFVACQNKALNEAMGKLNLGGFDRSRLMRGFVSKEQPSIIDDPSIRSGFYGAPTVIVIFGLKTFFTLCRMRSAWPRTWCLKLPNSVYHRVFWLVERKLSLTLKEKRFCATGTSPITWWHVVS